jgi:hypothetical protein
MLFGMSNTPGMLLLMMIIQTVGISERRIKVGRVSSVLNEGPGIDDID